MKEGLTGVWGTIEQRFFRRMQTEGRSAGSVPRKESCNASLRHKAAYVWNQDNIMTIINDLCDRLYFKTVTDSEENGVENT